MCGFLTAVASLVVELGSGVWASEAAAREPSSCISRAPERRFSGCGTWTQVLCGVDLPGPEIALVSPALAGGFFTTEPPGKPRLLSDC